MDTVGPYQILATLGSGGMGTVYRALEPRSGRELAVKVLRRDLERGRPEVAERFVREVQAAQALDHPSVVEVYGHGRSEDGTLYIAMELCQGEDLATCLKRGPLAVGEACGIAAEVAEALAHAHARGVVHRDLKPHNVFLTPSGCKLLDFGVARLTSSKARLTVGNVILGTPEYMAPEQARNEPDVDGRADLYSLGAILFECLTGVPPFTGDTPLAVLVRVLTESVRPVSSLRVDVPSDVDGLVSSLLQRDRERRRSDAAIVAAELRAFASRGQPTFGVGDGRSAGDPSQEMRIVTVLAALEIGDPGPLQAGARAQGGVEEYLGEGQMLAIFGAELSFGDEPARALRVAMAGRAGMARIGVASGRARAWTGGEVAGTVVEQAVRLAESASPGAVRLCPATAEATRGLFDVTRAADGSFELEGERPGGVAVRAFSTAFVGRDGELGHLLELFEHTTRSGAPQAVLVVGLAGIGKTRLKDELRAALEGRPRRVTTLEAYGDPLRSGVPYGALADALRTRIRPGAPSRGDNTSGARRTTIVGRTTHDSAPAIAPFRGVNRMRPPDSGNDPPVAQEPRRAVRSASSTDLLPHLTRYLDRLGQPERDADAIALAMGIDPRARSLTGSRELRSRMEDALVATLLAEARQAPTLFALEELQWIDLESMAVLGRALQEGNGLPLFLLALARPELLETLHPDGWGAAPPALFASAAHTVVRLGPLDPDASRALVLEVLQARTEVGESPALIEQIVAQGGGNPLYLQELAACAMPGAKLVPMSVENALQSHFDQLSPAERELCKRASVMGLSFWDAALPALGAAQSERALARLTVLEIVLLRGSSRFEGATEYAFAHALLRDAAYARLPEEQRAPLHLAFARWLEEAGEPDSAVLAHHWALGGDPEHAAAALVRAAEVALSAFANQAAVGHASAALALAAEPAGGANVRLAALAAREEGLHRLGRRGEQERDIDRLEAEATSDGQRVLAWSRRARHLRVKGRLAEAVLYLERALGLPADTDVALQADLLYQLGEILQATGRSGDALEMARQAVVAAQRIDPATGQDRLARALWLQGRTRADNGDLGGSLADHDRALTLLQARDDGATELPCLLSLAQVELMAGRAEEAEKSVRRALRRSQTQGRTSDPGLEALAEEIVSLSLSARDRGGQARIASMKALDLAERAGSEARRANALVSLARAEAALGSAEAVTDAAGEALELALEHGIGDAACRARVELSRARLAFGELAEARRLVEEALAARLAPGPGRAGDGDDELYAALARCRAATGDREAAIDAAGHALEVVAARARSLGRGPERERYLASPAASNTLRIAGDLGLALAPMP